MSYGSFKVYKTPITMQYKRVSSVMQPPLIATIDGCEQFMISTLCIINPRSNGYNVWLIWLL